MHCTLTCSVRWERANSTTACMSHFVYALALPFLCHQILECTRDTKRDRANYGPYLLLLDSEELALITIQGVEPSSWWASLAQDGVLPVSFAAKLWQWPGEKCAMQSEGCYCDCYWVTGGTMKQPKGA